MIIRQHPLFAIFLLLAITLAPSSAFNQTLSTEAFFRFNDLDGVKISPDGRHVAMTVPTEELGMLVVMEVETNNIVAQFDSRPNQKMGEFYWANNERILFSTVIVVGGLDAPLITGEIFALNIDNTKKLRLVGPEAGDIGAYRVSNLIRDDAEQVRVVRHDIQRRSTNRSRPSSYLLDIYAESRSITGRTQANLRGAVRSPLPWGNLFSDRAGNVRVATAMSEERQMQIHYRANDDSDWMDISDSFATDGTDTEFQFLNFSLDNSSFYLLKNTDYGTKGLVQFFPETQATEIIYQHPQFDIAASDIVLSNKQDAILGVKFFGDILETHYTGDHPEIVLHKSLDAAFPGERVRVTSATVDGKQAIISVAGPQKPGDYFIMNTETSQLTQVGSANSMLPKEQMATVQAFVIKSRDDLDLHGLVTLPKVEISNQPMIVIPHGGPIGIRDTLAFNREAQFFAHHGYVVLQVNFRGSGGLGHAFRERGYEQWGTGMIEDISLAVTWAIQNNIAARDKVCIYGGSYGAFAALASVIQEPDKYQCAIGYSGIYDLTTLDESDIPWNPGGGAYLEDALGTDETELARQSPINFTDNIKIPLFLAHGGEDNRAPVSQANRLRGALDESGVEYQWMLKRNEAHGFYNQENRIEFYDAVLAFVDQHLGSQ